MKSCKLLIILFICLTIVLISGVATVGAETLVDPEISLNAAFSPNESDCPNDFDCDGIDDDTELWLARTYSPYLVFDEDEQEEVQKTVIPLFQVTPYTYNGQDGAMLTFVFLFQIE